MTSPYDYGWSTVKQSRRPSSETPQLVIAGHYASQRRRSPSHRTRLASRPQPPQPNSTGPRPPHPLPTSAALRHRARRPGPRLSTFKHPSLRNARRSPVAPLARLLRNAGCGGRPAPSAHTQTNVPRPRTPHASRHRMRPPSPTSASSQRARPANTKSVAC